MAQREAGGHAAVAEVVGATTLRQNGSENGTAPSRLRHLGKGDYAPSIILALVILALGAYTYAHNARYLAPFNVIWVLTLLTTLAFISMGQTIVIMTGGIDLSVGPLSGPLMVIASFFVVDGKPSIVMVLAFVIMIAVAATSGLINGVLVRYGGFTAVAATLTLYIGLQGVSSLLRPFQGGYISAKITGYGTATISTSASPGSTSSRAS